MTSPAPDAAQPDVVTAPVPVTAPVATDPATGEAPAAPVDAPAPAPADTPVEAPAEAPAPADVPDPRVTKRRVTMRSAVMGSDGAVHTHEAVDFVRPDFLDAYLADVRGKWQFVEVSDAPDAGPAGYDGATFVPPHLDTPLANTYFPATGADGSDAPAGANVVTEA